MDYYDSTSEERQLHVGESFILLITLMHPLPTLVRPCVQAKDAAPHVWTRKLAAEPRVRRS
eukprot:COSAG02_NODE_64437_length_260_cov_0.968944_1_plen_60_part_01